MIEMSVIIRKCLLWFEKFCIYWCIGINYMSDIDKKKDIKNCYIYIYIYIYILGEEKYTESTLKNI